MASFSGGNISDFLKGNFEAKNQPKETDNLKSLEKFKKAALGSIVDGLC